MRTNTFASFEFCATHSLEGFGEAAAKLHSHRYLVEVWFEVPINQDAIAADLEREFGNLRGANLNDHMRDSSDEGIARHVFNRTKNWGRFRVVVRNGLRGAEALL